jgi:hypothetical protein
MSRPVLRDSRFAVDASSCMLYDSFVFSQDMMNALNLFEALLYGTHLFTAMPDCTSAFTRRMSPLWHDLNILADDTCIITVRIKQARASFENNVGTGRQHAYCSCWSYIISRDSTSSNIKLSMLQTINMHIAIVLAQEMSQRAGHKAARSLQ